MFTDKDGDEKDVIAAGAGLITAFADSVIEPGVDTKVTSVGHLITAADIAGGKTVPISGTTNYNGTHTVKRVIDDDNYEIEIAFVADDATGTFPIEKIYKLNPTDLTAIGVLNAMTGGTGEVFVCLQTLDPANLESSDIVWFSRLAAAGTYFKGDSSLIQGLKVNGNPTGGAISIVGAQGKRAF